MITIDSEFFQGNYLTFNNQPTRAIKEIVSRLVNNQDSPLLSDQICKLLYYNTKDALDREITSVQKEELVSYSDKENSKQRIFQFPKGQEFIDTECSEIRVYLDSIDFIKGTSKLGAELIANVEIITHKNLIQLNDGFNLRTDLLMYDVFNSLNGFHLGNVGFMECSSPIRSWALRDCSFVGYYMQFNCGNVML